jgi:hypothetical protein
MSIASIQGLTLAPLDRTDFGIEQTKSTGGGPSAVVNAGSLVGFEGGISEDEQEDILYSLQFAQRAASGAADRFTQIKGWYTKYVEVLTDVGWTLKNFELNEQKVDQSEVEVAKAAWRSWRLPPRVRRASCCWQPSRRSRAWPRKMASSRCSSTTARRG